MVETLDIRLVNDWAIQEFGESIGQPMFNGPKDKAAWERLEPDARERLRPFTRQVIIRTDDPFFPELRARILRAATKGTYVAGSISVSRSYSPEELEQADLIQLIIHACFKQGGEDSGTLYDDVKACPRCGLGREQRSPLRLNLSKRPKNADIARTLVMNECVVSERFVRLVGEQLGDVFFDRVEHVGRGEALRDWYQLKLTENAGKTCPPTRFGGDYILDQVNENYTCREHSLLGFNLLTEVWLSKSPSGDADLMVTEDRFGVWGGGVMPIAILVISNRLFRVLRHGQILGCTYEPIHVKGH